MEVQFQAVTGRIGVFRPDAHPDTIEVAYGSASIGSAIGPPSRLRQCTKHGTRTSTVDSMHVGHGETSLCGHSNRKSKFFTDAYMYDGMRYNFGRVPLMRHVLVFYKYIFVILVVALENLAYCTSKASCFRALRFFGTEARSRWYCAYGRSRGR